MLELNEIARRAVFIHEWYGAVCDLSSVQSFGEKGIVFYGTQCTSGEKRVYIHNGSWPLSLSLQEFDNLMRVGPEVLHSVGKGEDQ